MGIRNGIEELGYPECMKRSLAILVVVALSAAGLIFTFARWLAA